MPLAFRLLTIQLRTVSVVGRRFLGFYPSTRSCKPRLERELWVFSLSGRGDLPSSPNPLRSILTQAILSVERPNEKRTVWLIHYRPSKLLNQRISYLSFFGAGFLGAAFLGAGFLGSLFLSSFFSAGAALGFAGASGRYLSKSFASAASGLPPPKVIS